MTTTTTRVMIDRARGKRSATTVEEDRSVDISHTTNNNAQKNSWN
jgi:hypothetical protein